MTAISWSTDYLREPVLAMLRAGQINTIELDLKDESGVVGYDSKIPLANEDRRGQARVRDPRRRQADPRPGRPGDRPHRRLPRPGPGPLRLGQRRPRAGHPGPGRQPPTRATAASRTSPTRWCASYNIDVATEAARAGVDDILYDYVRRPDGPLETMVFPGLKGGAQASIVSFLAEARTALDPTGAVPGRVAVRHRRRPSRGGRPERARRSRATWTTWRRSSTRPTGAPASTACPSPSASRARSSRSR